MTIGFDTGFFVRLYQGHGRAIAAWEAVKEGEIEGVVSCLSLFEIERLGMRGALHREAAQDLVQELGRLCRIVWIEPGPLLGQAARLAHSHGLSMADSVILASFVEAEAEEIYTTDSDLARHPDGPRVVII